MTLSHLVNNAGTIEIRKAKLNIAEKSQFQLLKIKLYTKINR